LRHSPRPTRTLASLPVTPRIGTGNRRTNHSGRQRLPLRWTASSTARRCRSRAVGRVSMMSRERCADRCWCRRPRRSHCLGQADDALALYEHAFGLTMLRLSAQVFAVWLIAVFTLLAIWFIGAARASRGRAVPRVPFGRRRADGRHASIQLAPAACRRVQGGGMSTPASACRVGVIQCREQAGPTVARSDLLTGSISI
jgi:hypothetical protein